MSESFDITSDTELSSAVRTETGYDSDKVDSGDMDGLIDSAKRELALMADSTNFYADRGITHALVGLTCVKAKAHVENQPVTTKNLGPDDVTFRTTDGSSLQVQQYEESIRRGLANSGETEEGTETIRFTNTHLCGDVNGRY